MKKSNSAIALAYERSSQLKLAEDLSPQFSNQKIDRSYLERPQRLIAINTILKKFELRPIEQLGDHQQGEIEFIGINNIQLDAFVTRVDFQAIGAGGFQFNHLCFFNTNAFHNNGAIALVIINKTHIVLIKQFRPVLGKTIYDFPKGFPEKGKNLGTVKGLKTLELELEQETGIKLADLPQDCVELQLFSDIVENTGTSNIENDIFVLKLQLSRAQLKTLKTWQTADDNKSRLNVKLVPIPEVLNYVRDNHSLAAMGAFFCLNTKF